MRRGRVDLAFFRGDGVSNQGPVRSTNEDCFRVDNQLGLCVVADGMGGHNGGEVASRIAVDAVTDYVRAVDRDGLWPFGFDAAMSQAANVLRTAVHVANVQILEAAAASAELTGMGTTLVAALVDGDTLTVAHVGDSRLYLFVDGALRLLTRDDSWALMRNVLTNVVGTRTQIEVHLVERTLAGGELVALTTDGVHGAVDDARMERLLAAGGEPAEIAARLVRTAIGRGSRDNCTALVAAVEHPS
jgi:protein phosphatase